MNPTMGHLIRFSGLAIEMLGVWGVYNSIGSKDGGLIQLPGGTTVHWGWIVWAIGFAIWLTGRLIVHGSRTRRKPLVKDDGEPQFRA